MRGITFLRGVVLALCVLLLSGCGYNQIQSKDEAVKAGWSEVLNQYKRRVQAAIRTRRRPGRGARGPCAASAG